MKKPRRTKAKRAKRRMPKGQADRLRAMNAARAEHWKSKGLDKNELVGDCW
jgi:hypothetical protein